MATAPASSTQTAVMQINSVDRYASFEASRDPANWTTPTDITYTIPGLSKVSTLQLNNVGLNGGPWAMLTSLGLYNNVINVRYNGVTTLLTLPFDVPVQLTTAFTTVLQTFLRNTLNDQTIQFGYSFQASSPFPGGFQTYTTSLSASAYQYISWTSYSATVGFSRVASVGGVDITGYRQLFDVLGLPFQMIGGVPTSYISAIGEWAVALRQVNNTTSASQYYDIVSPDLDPLYPDLSTTPTAGQNGTMIARILQNQGANQAFVSTTIPGFLKSFRTKGTNTLRVRIIDDQGRPIPTKTPIPQVYRWTAINCTYSGSAGTGVVTVPATPNPLTNSGLIIGDKLATTTSIGTLCGIWTITNIATNTITITCPYSGTATGLTIGGPYIGTGNTVGFGGNTEYVLSFLVDYGSTVPVTTT